MKKQPALVWLLAVAAALILMFFVSVAVLILLHLGYGPSSDLDVRRDFRSEGMIGFYTPVDLRN